MNLTVAKIAIYGILIGSLRSNVANQSEWGKCHSLLRWHEIRYCYRTMEMSDICVWLINNMPREATLRLRAFRNESRLKEYDYE
jgi:hypothetical protein